jgi:hypothetical protein
MFVVEATGEWSITSAKRRCDLKIDLALNPSPIKRWGRECLRNVGSLWNALPWVIYPNSDVASAWRLAIIANRKIKIPTQCVAADKWAS